MGLTKGGQFEPFGRNIRRYFRAYGRWAGILGSPLFVASAIIGGVSYRQWMNEAWTSTAYNLLPSLLGFSLGTYAILFSLITSRVKGALRAVKNDKEISSLEQVNATFFHFIFMQVIALLWAFIYDGSLLTDLARLGQKTKPWVWDFFAIISKIGAMLGYILMIYSVCLVVGAALAIYRLALIADPAENG